MTFSEFLMALKEDGLAETLRKKDWTNERRTSEVDFVVQDNGNIIPYEVKSGENLKAKSFRLFCEKYTPVRAVRTALTPYRQEEWMTNIPLYGI